jgi:hypothetical protein
MARKIDAFAVAVGLEYYEDYLTVGDLVVITPNRMIMKDERQYGSIGKQEKYYDHAIEVLDILIRDGVHTLTGDDYVILEGTEIIDYVGDEYGNSAGKVIYTDGKMALLYLGTADEDYFFPEEQEPEDNAELIDNILATLEEMLGEGLVDASCEGNQEEVCYTLTEKGYDYLKQSEREEERTMDSIFGKFGFGKCVDSRFALSINGIAVRQGNTGKFVVYNKDNNEFVDTTDMLINVKDALFVLPATEINVGDTVIHENKAYYIVGNGREIKAVSYDDCTQTVLIPKSTMFGLKYFTKVFSMFGDNFAATGELFSNPMMLMALISGEGNTDISKLLLFSSLSKGEGFNNPMLMSMLLKDDSKSDLSTFAMMSMLGNGTNPFAPKAPKAKDKE